MDRDALLALSKNALIEIILAQTSQIGALLKRVAELEARLNTPPKTPHNSSAPPSKGHKTNRPGRPGKPRRGRPGTARTLEPDPDRIIEATLDACPHCQHALGALDQPGIHAYDHIDLPPIVTRIHRHRGVRPCRRKRVTAPHPRALSPAHLSDPASAPSLSIST